MKVKIATEKFMRTVGYYGSVKDMNDGKREEHAKRQEYGV